MTLVRRLAAMGTLWLVVVAATAPAAAAGGLLDLEPDSGPTSDCPTSAILALACLSDLPVAPVTDLVLAPDGTGLVPGLVEDVDGLLSLTDPLIDPLPVSELLTLTEPLTGQLPVTQLLQPVAEILAPTNPEAPVAATDPAVEGPAAPPAPAPIIAPASGTAALPGEAEPAAHHARALEQAVTAAVSAPDATRRVLRVTKAEAAGASKLSATLGGDEGVPALPIGAAVAALLMGGGASVALDLARGGGGGLAGVVAFNVWLRRQLRETRMSQRQLAAFSGVDHSTISRLLSGEHTPSLATATKLVEALRKLGGLPNAAEYFARLSESRVIPTKRVEEALLGDDELDDQDVRQLMQAYLVARARRRRERNAAAGNGSPMATEGQTPA